MQRLLIYFCFLAAPFCGQAQTLNLQPDSIAGKDAWVFSLNAARTINFGVYQPNNQSLHNVIRAESWQWNPGVSDTIRSFIAFDLTALPASAQITEAKLSLFFYANPGFTQQVGNNQLVVERVTQSWDEATINWNNQPTTTTQNQLVIPASTRATQDYLDLDVTSLVHDMVNNPLSSYGFRLSMLDEIPFRGVTFASSDHENSALHPKLSITYTTPNGLKKASSLVNELRVFPNPTTNRLDLLFENQNLSQIQVRLMDLVGHVVYLKSQHKLKPGTQRLSLTLPLLSPGTYHLVLSHKDQSLTQSIVIQ